MNTIRLNTIGILSGGGNAGGGGGGDIPSGYAEFITADDMVFSASDGAFYVKL